MADDEGYARIDDFLSGDEPDAEDEDGIRLPVSDVDGNEEYHHNDEYQDYEADQEHYEYGEHYRAGADKEYEGALFSADMDTAAFNELLESVGYNLSLLGLGSSLSPAGISNADPVSSTRRSPAVTVIQASTSTPAPPTATICRHLLAGGCYRSDCWFSHDLSQTACKFFLGPTGCANGSSCPFLHDTGRIVSAVTAAMDPNGFDAGEEDDEPVADLTAGEFPTLSTNTPTVAAKFDFWGPSAPFNEALKRAPIPSTTQRFPPGFAKPAASGTAARFMANNDAGGRRVKVSLGWVGTGGSVDALYRKHRAEAAEAAEQRNRLFERAATAFRSGNAAAAKTFSVEARKWDVRLKELNQEAGARIFETRNGIRAATAASDGERVIDLHGLHGDEGVHFMESALRSLKQESFVGTVSVITGTGNHSKGSFAKVAPQIRAYLREKGFIFREGTMDDGRGGIFIVTLR